MPTITDYIIWRGDLSFSKAPFNEVDALIFTQLSYIDFSSAVPSSLKNTVTLAEAYLKISAQGGNGRLGALLPSDITTLFEIASKAERFKNVLLSGYVNKVDDEKDEQFSAVTFVTDKKVFVAYRGTDDSLTGWKEDFKLSYMKAVPAQREAEAYLYDVLRSFKFSPISLGGHSKGGNLAVYATLGCDKRKKRRIEKCFNFDGPGFRAEVLKAMPQELWDEKIENIMPAGSVVGRLFERIGVEKIVKSSGKTLMQHNAFLWEVMGSAFVEADERTESSIMAEKILSGWIDEMTGEERELLVEALFEVLKGTEAKTLTDIMADKLGFLKSISCADKEKKKQIKQYTAKILEQAAKHVIK